MSRLNVCVRNPARPACPAGLACLAGLLAAASPTAAPAQAPSPILPRHVDQATVQALDRGLSYLAGTQRQDGSWVGSPQGGSYPCVMTGLAGLALMANGSTPTEGKYADNISRAMEFLLRCGEKTRMVKDGKELCVLSSETGNEMRSMYGHGFAMLFLTQCYGCELSPRDSARVRRVLEGAANLISASQSTLGGWYYSPESNADEGSVTVTQMQPLRAARDAGIKVNKQTIDRAVGYLEKSEVREPDGTSGIAYQASQARGGGGGARPPISAAAVVVLFSGGKYESDAFAKRCLEYTRRRYKNDGNYQGHYFYSHMYISQAMYQAGGKDWDDYFPWFRDKLKQTQSADGSWEGDGVGRTYGTAIACLILQLPYNYLPMFQR
jgi:hypothetical protein